MYSVVIDYSVEDDGYIATVPDLPGCSAWGRVRMDAAGEIGPAIEAWMQAAHAAGNAIPRPSHPTMFLNRERATAYKKLGIRDVPVGRRSKK